MEIYAKLQTISEGTFAPTSVVFAKNDAGIFQYFESSMTIEFIEDLKSHSSKTNININELLEDEYLKQNIDGNLIYLLTIDKAKSFLENNKMGMDKQCFRFLTSFLRKDKIKNFLEENGD